MIIRKALFGLILACGASVISLAACGDDDDTGGTSGSGGASGTAGKSGSGSGGGSGSSGVGGTGGSAPVLTCKDKFEVCNGDVICAKLLYCGSVCGALGIEQGDFIAKCTAYAGFANGPQLIQALAVGNCASGVCADDCGRGAGGAGAGGAGAGGAGAGGAGAGGAGAGGAGAGGAGQSGASGEGGAGAGGGGGGAGGGGGGTAGSGGPTCPPSDFQAPSKCTDSGLSTCVSCQCSN